MTTIRNIACLAFLLALVIPAFAEDVPSLPQKMEIATGGLSEKLVNGSPWRFTTQYENTVHHFRFSSDGKLQRMSSSNPDVWKDFPVSETQTASYGTKNGHVIMFALDSDGSPTATHSKYVSQFKSIKSQLE